MTNPEYENLSSRDKLKQRDQSGFSEKQLDIDVETGAFKRRRKPKKKILFPKPGS